MDGEPPTTEDPAPSRRHGAVPIAIVALVVIMVGAVASVIYVGSVFGDGSVGTASPPTTIGGTEPVSFVPGLGTLTWTELEAPSPNVHDAWNPITFDQGSGYRWFHGPGERVWNSTDGLQWTSRSMPAFFGDFRIDELRDSGLAVGVSADGRYLVARWTDDGWVEVADLSPITDTTGVVWTPRLGWLTQFGDVVYSDAWLTGELPWATSSEPSSAPRADLRIANSTGQRRRGMRPLRCCTSCTPSAANPSRP